MQEIKNKRRVLEQELTKLAREKKAMHCSLMQEQQRIAKSKASGQKKMANNRWTKSAGDLKAMKAEKSQGNKLVAITNKKQEIIQQLADLRLPEIIVPKFSLSSHRVNDTVVAINKGTITYDPKNILLKNIDLVINAKEKIAIIGDNGSGKSTLIKAIIKDPCVLITGDWFVPKIEDIGYLEQHYNTLERQATVFDTIQKLVPHWTQLEIRRHLTDFLFYSNEEINAKVYTLSGGEKARLSLAQIAAKTPRLLILDEITNNLDLETIGHVIDILREYPGAMIVISHSLKFIHALKIKDIYEIDVKKQLLCWRK
jgi:ATPase subunit of ABC transporter with duplicated ATPase domains